MNFEKMFAWTTFVTQIVVMTIKHDVLRFNVFGEIPIALENMSTIQTPQINSTKLIVNIPKSRVNERIIVIEILLKPELLLYITQEISFMLGSSVSFKVRLIESSIFTITTRELHTTVMLGNSVSFKV